MKENFETEEKLSPKKSPGKHRQRKEFDLSEIDEDNSDPSLKKLIFLGEIGEGAFGKVYQGRTHGTNEECAIKVKFQHFQKIFSKMRFC